MRSLITVWVLLSFHATLLAQVLGPAPNMLGGTPVNGSGPVAANCSADGTVVNAITGEPVPRARVSVGGVVVSADAGGRFHAQGVRCGPMVPLATKPGFVQNVPRPGLTAGVRSATAMLEAGTTVHDIRVPLTPQAVIVGVVTDGQGDPVMGAQVSVLSSRVLQGKRMFQQTQVANTNDLGEFRIHGLAAGRYVVCARAIADAMVLATSGDPRGGFGAGEKCYPGPPDGSVSSTFDLPAGREVRLPLTLPESRSLHVRGTIAGLQNARNLSLTLVRRGTALQGANRSGPVTAEGRFDIGGVTPGSYMLSADAWEDNTRYTARVPVDVGSSDVEGLTVRLVQGFSVAGVVRVEGGEASMPPRQQFALSLRSSEPMAGGGRVNWDPDGSRFTLADMTPGSYRLESFGSGNYYIKRAMFNGRDISREDVAITQPGGGIELVLGMEGGSIDGQVFDNEGKPVAAWIMLVEEGRAPRSSTSNESGMFRMPSVAPGAYTVYAWDDLARVEYANPDWMRRNGSGEKITVESGQTEHVKLVRKEAPDR
jgi:hypothetical protein